MEYSEENLIKLFKNLNLNKEIMLNDIPKLDLYMDQVITLFETELGHLKRNTDDKILTKTMINNYTKEKILMPPNKKKYSREHIMLLAITYYLKQILSIGDIKCLSKHLIDDNDNNSISIKEFYECFLKIKQNEINDFEEIFRNYIKIIDEKSSTISSDNKDIFKMLLTVMALINSANIQKKLAEKIIDEYFSNI